MKLLSQEHYDLMAAFERHCKPGRIDKESKDLWAKGIVYQDGHVNERFKVYRMGYELGKTISAGLETVVGMMARHTHELSELKDRPVSFDRLVSTVHCQYRELHNLAVALEARALAGSENETRSTAAWIPVTERLPEQGVDVLFCDESGICFGYKAKDDSDSMEWIDKLATDRDGHYCDTYTVTHWMPLPEAPKP